eukprot:Gb_36393 [translate_table: standard]
MDFTCWLHKITSKCNCKQYVEGSLPGDGTCKMLCCWHKFLLLAVLLLLAAFVSSLIVGDNYAETVSRWYVSNAMQKPDHNAIQGSFSFPMPSPAPNPMQGARPVSSAMQKPAPSPTQSVVIKESKEQHEGLCNRGSRPLPKGLVHETSDLEMRSLWGDPTKEEQRKTPQNLLAIPVGINQKENVDQIIQKFPSDNFTVMLFHYDGVTDKWNDLKWSEKAIRVTAINQTKWWFAKRFLHPDIVAAYNYIFLWDEDLGVGNFNANRYLAIMEDEGLEISQPALDISKSEVHHGITMRIPRSRVHRRMYKTRGGNMCFENSTAPPCTGWVEMMAPVFSRYAWHCSWGMIQNDLVHGWGIDMKLGYCTQGDRSKKVGVIDSEYIVHHGIPSLGRLNDNNLGQSGLNKRVEIRRRAFYEMNIFKQRWAKAVRQDKCWVDPYWQPRSKIKSQRMENVQRN